MESGTLLGLVSNYGINIALISRGFSANPSTNYLLISLFHEVMEAHPEYPECIPTVTEKTIDAVIRKINMKVKAWKVKNLVLARYQLAMQN